VRTGRPEPGPGDTDRAAIGAGQFVLSGKNGRSSPVTVLKDLHFWKNGIVLSGVERTGPPRWRTGPCRPTRPGPRAGCGRVADRATGGSAACRSGATRSLPTGYPAAAVLAKSVWQAGYALKRRGAESLRHGEGIPRTQVTMVRYGLVCLARSAAAEPHARSAGGEAAAAEGRLRVAGTRVCDTGRRGAKIGAERLCGPLASRPVRARPLGGVSPYPSPEGE